MRGAIDPEPTRLGERRHIALVGLDAALPRDHTSGCSSDPPRSPRAQSSRDTAPPTRSRCRSRAGSASGPAPQTPRRTRVALVAIRRSRTTVPSSAMIRIWLSLAVQIDGTILHGWLLLCALSAFNPRASITLQSRTASRFISSLNNDRQTHKPDSGADWVPRSDFSMEFLKISRRTRRRMS